MRHTVIRPPAGTAPPSTGILPGQRTGLLIGGIFGLIYVEANAGLLPDPWAPALQVAAGVTFAGLAVLLARHRGLRSAAWRSGRGSFGGSYWLVVAGEAAAILAGAALLNGPAGLPQAVVAWVSLVVGVHFLVLASMWRFPLCRILGAGIGLCGAAGLTAAAGGAAPAVIAATGGVLPGVLLLTACCWGANSSQQLTPGRREGHAGPASTGSSQDSLPRTGRRRPG